MNFWTGIIRASALVLCALLNLGFQPTEFDLPKHLTEEGILSVEIRENKSREWPHPLYEVVSRHRTTTGIEYELVQPLMGYESDGQIPVGFIPGYAATISTLERFGKEFLGYGYSPFFWHKRGKGQGIMRSVIRISPENESEAKRQYKEGKLSPLYGIRPMAAVDYPIMIHVLYELTAEKIVLLGHSMGGWTLRAAIGGATFRADGTPYDLENEKERAVVEAKQRWLAERVRLAVLLEPAVGMDESKHWIKRRWVRPVYRRMAKHRHLLPFDASIAPAGNRSSIEIDPEARDYRKHAVGAVVEGLKRFSSRVREFEEATVEHVREVLLLKGSGKITYDSTVGLTELIVKGDFGSKFLHPTVPHLYVSGTADGLASENAIIAQFYRHRHQAKNPNIFSLNFENHDHVISLVDPKFVQPIRDFVDFIVDTEETKGPTARYRNQLRQWLPSKDIRVTSDGRIQFVSYWGEKLRPKPLLFRAPRFVGIGTHQRDSMSLRDFETLLPNGPSPSFHGESVTPPDHTCGKALVAGIQFL